MGQCAGANSSTGVRKTIIVFSYIISKYTIIIVYLSYKLCWPVWHIEPGTGRVHGKNVGVGANATVQGCRDEYTVRTRDGCKIRAKLEKIRTRSVHGT